MNKYQEGKIYKIVNDSISGVYYGSTIRTLEERFIGHINDCKNKKSNCSSKELFKYGEPKIILVQNKPCNSRKELEKREGWFIKNFKCINKVIPLRTKKEWYEVNKERINEQQSQIHNCVCGSKYTHTHKLRHLKTKMHQNYIKTHPCKLPDDKVELSDTETNSKSTTL